MKRATFSVLFYVKHTKQLKDGTLPVFARITVNGQRAEFSVQRSVQEGLWDSIKGMAKNNTRQNKETNAYLEEIADLCGIKKHLSTHTSRDTFATTVTLANQVSIEVVSKMLGHSSINMTKKYARVVDDLIKRDMEKIFQKFERVGVN